MINIQYCQNLFVLSETNSRNTEQIRFPNFQFVNRQKQINPQYEGVAIYIKNVCMIARFYKNQIVLCCPGYLSNFNAFKCPN